MNLVQRLKLYPALLRPHWVALANAQFEERYDKKMVLRRYLAGLGPARRHRHLFDQVRFYCFFIGWPRSGHSLLGSLLDAHPNIVIAHELDALPLADAGFSRTHLFSAILANARVFAEHRGWSGYSYQVPGQSQGRFERLHVIGDKKGGQTSAYLALINPRALDELRRCVRVPLKVILYHRNPFDVLATVTRRAGRRTIDGATMDRMVESLVPTVSRIREELSADERIEIYHEDFVASPRRFLAETVRWLGEEPAEAYLDATTGIVKPVPQRSRDAVVWSRADIERLESASRRYPCWERYSFQT